MTRDRWILTTAWALIATAGAAGLWKTSKIPAMDAEIARQCERLRKEMSDGPVDPVPPDHSLALVGRQWKFEAEGVRPHAKAAYFAPRIVERTVPGIPVDVAVMALTATPAAKASLDGATVTWTLAKGPVALKPRERAKDVAPTGLRVERNDGSGWKEVAKLDAKAASWKDVETAPRRTYAYRVKLDAPKEARAAADGPEAEARTPSDQRARLVGGDAKVAIFKVETYQRKSGSWVGRDVTVRPGDELWPGGWKLTGLRFKGFALVAEAVVEDGRAVELTTRD
ncbi:MAG TPA: hypothetical protein VF950_23560 [Planctomycetota bacterium]